jgi:Putative zinc-finger
MCEFSQKLIAWFDRELPVDEALEVELHLGGCADCQRELRRYEWLSIALDAYCDAAVEASAPRSEPSWKPAALGAAAVAAILVLLLASPHGRKAPTTSATPAMASGASTLVAETQAAVPLNRVIPSPRRRARDLSSSDAKGKRDSSANDTPRFTENLLFERNVNALNALNIRATPVGAGWQALEPAIQIAIPAEAVLPPGAAPEGVSFVAEVSIGPDGLAHQILLQP